jgi:hypothetical protein
MHMPEATMDENCEPSPLYRDIWITRQAADVRSVPISKAV